ncbi:polymer-forming cytoskeletal protein [Pseudoroseomonas cervicalis]|uniref:bactofilin family protein n=1 Tax=Teichococcus cervicalis TaxID=204525 RepID=UPI0027820B6D|nr:polymer-forming cytoskeletal protein [Pseudoroseomonas cervicalis]MDQ1077575.1 cytoskeletal protein CcmA (bactofilin family) [Pseudoroseomonas cervicalis]
MSIFGKPSGGEPRITFERIDLSAAGPSLAEDATSFRGLVEAAERAPAERTPAERIGGDRQEPRIGRGAPQPASVMLVAADSELEGRLRSRGVVRVEGVLRGTLHAPVLLLEPGGLIEGTVTVERARICGTLRGTLLAREVEVVRTASLDAELVYDEISVERGARLRGLHRQRDPEPKPAEMAPEEATAEPPAAMAAAEAGLTVSLAVSPELAAAAAASTAALVAEAEAALHSLAQATQAAAEAVADLAEEGVPDLVALEAELRATPEELLIGKPALG